MTPTPTPRLTTVEGGIAKIRFEERAIVLDQRAIPIPAATLTAIASTPTVTLPPTRTAIETATR